MCNKTIIRLCGLLYAGLGLVVLPLAAQSAEVSRAPASVAATRMVAQWTEQEIALDEALLTKDKSRVAQWLAAEFEFHATEPSRHLDQKGWLAQERKAASVNRELRELQVRESGSVVLVSFVRVSGNAVARAEFVVDVWRTADNKLVARYSSPSWKTQHTDTKPDGRY